MFVDDQGIAVAEEAISPMPEVKLLPIEESKAPDGHAELPPFIKEINSTYLSSRAHVFILHGGVNDYPDNTGIRSSVAQSLSTVYDHHCFASKCLGSGITPPQNPSELGKPLPVVATWSIANGLQFASTKGQEAFLAVLKSSPRFAAFTEEQITPIDQSVMFALLNAYFKVSTELFYKNRVHREVMADTKRKTSERAAARIELQKTPEVNFTLLYEDAKMSFPAGEPVRLGVADRNAVAFMERWALDGSIAPRNKIILITQQLREIQESLRSGDSHIVSVRVDKPTLADRKEWISNFSKYIAKNPARVNGKLRTQVDLPEDVSMDIVATMTAGMSRTQIEGIFMESWRRESPVDVRTISSHKKEAIETEYGDILDIQQPTGGWKLLGYHNALVQWANRMIVRPMRLGDRRNMTRGAVLAGPPGTGKTHFANCLAAECGVNFIKVDFSKFLGGIVGQTERNMERFKEAVESMSPCLVLMDELDMSGLSRTGGGDSGVSTRLLSSLMQWLSDDARWGKVVALAATNRPDNLDSALIRPGRLDQILAVLPPASGDAEGRLAILKALTRKSNVVFNTSLSGTETSTDTGLGRLLHDKRIWTGAEMEALLMLAYNNAYHRRSEEVEQQVESMSLDLRAKYEYIREHTKQVSIDRQDWDKAMQSYRPKTRDVEKMIDIALHFCNTREFVPAGWTSQFEKEEELDARVDAYHSHPYERG